MSVQGRNDLINYNNFDILIGRPDDQNRYPVTLLHSWDGNTNAVPQLLPSADQSISHLLAWTRELVAERDDVKELGQALYKFLFPAPIEKKLYTSLGAGNVRIRIRWDTDLQALGRIPWECLHDGTNFLLHDKRISLIRFPHEVGGIRIAKQPQPVRILLVSASPRNLAPLNAQSELTKIRQALSDQESLVHVDVLEEATADSFRDKLQAFQPHILHIAAHGGQTDGAGTLILNDNQGQAAEITTEDLAVQLRASDTRFVLLNACHTADGKLLSLAPYLVKNGTPAVLGMQYAIPDQFAINFMNTTYRELSQHGNIEQALTAARQIGYGGEQEKGYWLIPALFMNTADGRLWTTNQAESIADTAPQTISRRLMLALTALLGILVIGVGLGIFWALAPDPVTEMSGDFRIAVAEFQWIGPDEPDDITGYSNGIYLRLEQLLGELTLPFTVGLWGPDQVGRITSDSEKARAEQAAQRATEIGADVVVYGVIDGSDPFWTITPAFYIAPQTLSDAQEITGQHAIGHPFSTPGNTNAIATRITISDKLTARTDLLSNIVVGLAFYSANQYDRSIEFFTNVQEVPEWEDVGGQELIYLLTGNAAGKNGDYAEAEIAYNRALEIDPEYSRAYVGLSSIRYIEATSLIKQPNGSNDFSKLDAALLEESLTLIDQAKRAQNQPILANIDTKIHFNRGQALLMLGFISDVPVENMITEFEAVLLEFGDFQAPQNEAVRELAAESSGRLGLLYLMIGEQDQAIRHYEDAVELLVTNPEKQKVYQERLDSLTP